MNGKKQQYVSKKRNMYVQTQWIYLTPLSGRIFKIASIGVYPQSDVSFAIVYIDALKGFVDLWVHFFVAIEDIHRNGYQQKSFFLVLMRFKHA